VESKGSHVQVLSSSKKLDNVAGVVPLWTCPDLYDGVEYAEDGSDRIFACVKELLKILAASDKIGGIVLDPSAPFPMAQIIYRVFDSARNVERWLPAQLAVFSEKKSKPQQAQQVIAVLHKIKM
jgi:hypothetical protein